MKGIFEKEWRLNFTQCYSNGRLKYSELNNMLQVTASEHAEHLGFGYQNMSEANQVWVLSRMLIEIITLPRYTETVVVKTWIQDFTGSRTQRNFEVIQDDRVIIRASSLWVVFNLKTRRAATLSLGTDHMVYHPDRTTIGRDLKKIDGRAHFTILTDYWIRLSDLDIANHANNVKYMEWCFDAISPERVLAGKIRYIAMNFLKELHGGDTVQIGINDTNAEEQTFCIKKAEQLHFLMEINWG